MENEQAKFEGWAIVELMGHQREAGFVTTEAYGQAVLFRVDVPEIPERQEVLAHSEWDDEISGYLSPGTTVLRVKVPARSRLISPSAIYALNPCTEEAVRKAVSKGPRKLILLELPKDRLLTDGDPEFSEDVEE